MSTNPIELLRSIYKKLENGDQQTVKQAVDAIQEMQAELNDLKSSLARQPLPEAPASLNVKVVDPATQLDYQVTVRESTAGRLLISQIPAISKALAEQGLIAFDAYVDQRKAERQENKAPQPASHNVPPVVAHNGGQGDTFEAKILVATVNEGKAYWKVKGGKFEKFGVTVWPEVLQEAGWFVDELNVMETYNLTGWRATYTTKDGGNPDKVVKLSKTA